MRRILVGLVALVFVASCGAGNSSSTPTTEATPIGKCSPTDENPTLGLAAINQKYRVVVWDTPGSNTPRELEQIGDDPFAESYGSDYTVVESVAISPLTCALFIGACCEPVSGITYYDKGNDGEWDMLTGHLPAISPDGELLSLVAYEELVVSSVADPEKAIATFNLPKADQATMYRAHWINGDEVAISGFTSTGAYVWIARMSEGTVQEAFQITPDVTWDSENLWRVGLIGIDESGNIVTSNASSSTSHVIEYRYPESFEVFKSDNVPELVMSYVMKGARSAMVSTNGALTVWYGTGDPVKLDGAYAWAG